MKRKQMFLGLALLLCGGSAMAQTTEQKTPYEKFKTFFENIQNVATWNEQVKDYDNRINNLKDNEPAKEEKIKETVINPVYTAINNFSNRVLGLTTQDGTISYCVVSEKRLGITTNTLILTTSDVTKQLTDVTEEWKEATGSVIQQALEGENETELGKYAFNTKLPVQFKVAYINKDGKCTYTPVKNVSKAVEDDFRSVLYGMVDVYIEGLSTWYQEYFTYEKETLVTTAAWTQWDAKVKQLEAERKAIQDKINAASTVKEYSLESDIEVPADNYFADKEWPAGYTLQGNYHHINLNGNKTLFYINSGNIYNVISTEGTIAMDHKGIADNCFTKASNGKYNVYVGNEKESFDNIEDAVYANRNVFGYDLDAKTVNAVNDDNKLYSASYTSASNKTEKQTFMVNINKGNVTDGKGLSAYSGKNAFIYIENKDVPTTTINTYNVVANGVCQNAKIEENDINNDKEKNEFYIPASFTVENLTYERNFKTDIASVCLPFAFTEEMKNEINEKLKSDGAEMYFYNFRSMDMSTNTIEANEPAVVAFTNGYKNAGTIFNGLKNVKFIATPDNLARQASSDKEDTAKRFIGNYKGCQTPEDMSKAGNGVGHIAYSFSGETERKCPC